MAPSLIAMASNLIAMASNLIVMASNPIAKLTTHCIVLVHEGQDNFLRVTDTVCMRTFHSFLSAYLGVFMAKEFRNAFSNVSAMQMTQVSLNI